MKSFALLVLALFAGVAFATSCTTYTTSRSCAPKNGVCSRTTTGTNIVYVECSYDQGCNGTTVGDYSGYCVSTYAGALGDTCKTQLDCGDALYCDTAAGKCASVTYQVGNGGDCDPLSKICSVNYVCSAGKCAAAVGNDQDCSAIGSVCNLGYYCNSFNHKCTKMYTGTAGTNCSAANFGATFQNMDCAAGFYCGSGAVCVAGGKSSLKSCDITGTNQCTSPEACAAHECKDSTVQYACQQNPGNSQTAINYEMDLYSCQTSNNNVCDDKTSCNKCLDASCCVGTFDGLLNNRCNNQCAGHKNCAPSTSSAVVVAASAVFIVAALFAL